MNRPYRGKRIDNGEWVYGNLLTTHGGDTWINIQHTYIEPVKIIEVHPDTIGQSTGLLDKNGTEGYAGSNIKARHKTDSTEIDDVIVWDEDHFLWGVQMDGWIMPLKTLIDTHDFTIHGEGK